MISKTLRGAVLTILVSAFAVMGQGKPAYTASLDVEPNPVSVSSTPLGGVAMLVVVITGDKPIELTYDVYIYEGEFDLRKQPLFQEQVQFTLNTIWDHHHFYVVPLDTPPGTLFTAVMKVKHKQKTTWHEAPFTSTQ